MSGVTSQRPGRRYARTMTTSRHNTELSAAVDQALIIAQQQGRDIAAAFLEARGAGFALICRVLAEPARRRASVDLAPLSS